MIIVSFKSRPIWERSWVIVSLLQWVGERVRSYLDIVSLVVVTALTEQTVVYNIVDVQLIKERITVL